MTRIKICGVTMVEQARACVEMGAAAIGVNFIPASPRRVSEERARAIVGAVGSAALVVGVVADLGIDEMKALREATGVGCLQLHGDESRESVAALLPHAYKAVAVGTAEDAAYAEAMPGDYVLVDAKVQGILGGTGQRVDTALITHLATKRRLVLAGGLTPRNVAEAVRIVMPWCVDTASGVEEAPGVKDMAKIKAFVEAVRTARVSPRV